MNRLRRFVTALVANIRLMLENFRISWNEFVGESPYPGLTVAEAEEYEYLWDAMDVRTLTREEFKRWNELHGRKGDVYGARE